MPAGKREEANAKSSSEPGRDSGSESSYVKPGKGPSLQKSGLPKRSIRWPKAWAGVEQPRHRLIFLALVLPVSFFGTLAFIVAGVACIVCFSDVPSSGIWGPVLLIVELALLVVFRLSADFVRRMVAAAAWRSEADGGIEDDHAHS